MEQLIQKYIKYFYATVICIILTQLIDVIILMLTDKTTVETIALMLTSALNLVLFSDCIKHNINQRFTECKTDLHVLRITVIPLMVCQILFCLSQGFSLIMLMNHIGIVALVELILTYRIKSLIHLENLVNQYMKYEREEGSQNGY